MSNCESTSHPGRPIHHSRHLHHRCRAPLIVAVREPKHPRELMGKKPTHSHAGRDTRSDLIHAVVTQRVSFCHAPNGGLVSVQAAGAAPLIHSFEPCIKHHSQLVRNSQRYSRRKLQTWYEPERLRESSTSIIILSSHRKNSGSLPPPKRAYPTHSDNESDNESEVVPMRKRIKKEVTNDDDGIVEADDTHPPSKTTRISTLITGPESKARITGVNARTRRAKVRKSDLGKLARIMDLPIDAFCEVRRLCMILREEC